MPRQSSGLAAWLKPLLALYAPTMLVVCALLLALAIGLAVLFANTGFWVFLLLATLVVFPVLHVLWALAIVFRLSIPEDPLELRLPLEMLEDLYVFVAEVARKRECPLPAEIRIVADTVAFVREDDDGRNILIVGGLAISTFTQAALAGVIAHELGHFQGGDTRLSRAALKRHLLMDLLEYRLNEQPGAKLNPLIWLLLGYHFLYRRARAAHSRQQEYAADRYTVDHVGKYQAAAALVLMMLTHRLPWVRLSNIAEAFVETSQPIDQIFTEQRRRAASVGRSEWEEACQKELRHETEPLDTHPSLKERLKAIKVSPKNALKYALDQPGPPARDLIPAWPEIERMLTDQLIAVYREAHLAKREIAQIIIGRPR